MTKLYYYLHSASDKLLMREKSHEFFALVMREQKPRLPDNLDIVTFKNEQGKPYFHAPFDHLWYNISHCPQGFALVISDEFEVGVDIEHPRRLDNVLKFAHRFFHPDELAYLGSLMSHSIEDVDAVSRNPQVLREFFKMWNVKEAIVKSYGGSIFESKKLNTVHRRGVIIKDVSVFDITDLQRFERAAQSDEMDLYTHQVDGAGLGGADSLEVHYNQIALPQAPEFQLAIGLKK